MILTELNSSKIKKSGPLLLKLSKNESDFFSETRGILLHNICSVLLTLFGVLTSEGWRRLGNPPPRQQEPLVVEDKVWRPPCELILFSALTLLLVDRKGVWPVKAWCCSMLVAIIRLELYTSCSSSCHQLVLSSLASIKCRMKTFWYRFTGAVRENGC